MLPIPSIPLCQIHCLETLGCQGSCTVRIFCAAQTSAWGTRQCLQGSTASLHRLHLRYAKETMVSAAHLVGVVLHIRKSTSSCHSMTPSQMTLPRIYVSCVEPQHANNNVYSLSRQVSISKWHSWMTSNWGKWLINSRAGLSFSRTLKGWINGPAQTSSNSMKANSGPWI